ncbi:MAG: cell division protein FtsZ [Bacteriovoracaceae bacterium]
MFEITKAETQGQVLGAKIKVIGVGGGGCNAVNTMISAGLTGVDYVVANTDKQALSVNLADTKIQLGNEITKGLGAGANPDVGRKAALEEYEKLGEILEGADMVFITAGMGGGTGTGAAPVIAKLCKELGILTVGVVTKPFIFEGKKRSKQAKHGITELENVVDSLITIPNQRLLYLAGESLSLVETFKKADEVLLNAVRGISDLINNTGHINADFADVSTVMANKGLALMGTGLSDGPDRAIKAATEAISSPLLEDISIEGATGIIINITGNDSLTMHETNEAVTLIMEAADDDAEIIFGTVIDENMNEDVKVTVIATGLAGSQPQQAVEAPVTERVETVTEAPVQAVREPAVEEVAVTETVEVKREEPVFTTPATTEEVHTHRAAPAGEAYMQTAENQEERRSNLVSSIKEAASQYMKHEDVTGTQTRATEEKAEVNTYESGVNRAKTIAEKLGFVGFDEETLDKPSYLRSDRASERRPEA